MAMICGQLASSRETVAPPLWRILHLQILLTWCHFPQSASKDSAQDMSLVDVQGGKAQPGQLQGTLTLLQPTQPPLFETASLAKTVLPHPGCCHAPVRLHDVQHSLKPASCRSSANLQCLHRVSKKVHFLDEFAVLLDLGPLVDGKARWGLTSAISIRKKLARSKWRTPQLTRIITCLQPRSMKTTPLVVELCLALWAGLICPGSLPMRFQHASKVWAELETKNEQA